MLLMKKMKSFLLALMVLATLGGCATQYKDLPVRDGTITDSRQSLRKVFKPPAQRSSTGKILTYKLAEREEMRFEQFDGLTFHEQWRKLEAEIARNEPPVIHESFKLDRSYVYGIGLKIVLDVDVINQASIEAAIDRFIEIGETDWVSPEPVPRDHLPVVSEHEALATITFPAE